MIIKKVIPSFSGLALIISLTGCFLLPQEDEILQPPLRAPDRIEYSTVEVTRGNLSDEVRGFGVVEARTATSVSFGIAGRLGKLHFISGSDVEEGDLLAELVNDDLVEALQRQEIYTRLDEIVFEQSRRGATRLNREAAQLRFDLSKLDLEKAQEAVEKTRLYAPMSGRIVYTTNTRIDDFVSVYQSIYTIADTANLNLRVTDSFASQIPLGVTVNFIFNDVVHSGTVVQVPSLNPNDADDKNVTVIECDTLDIEDMPLGTSFTIFFSRASVENAIVVDRSLIRSDGGRSYVIMLDNGTPVERNVTLGIVTGSFAEILDGLQEGEFIVY